MQKLQDPKESHQNKKPSQDKGGPKEAHFQIKTHCTNIFPVFEGVKIFKSSFPDLDFLVKKFAKMIKS